MFVGKRLMLVGFGPVAVPYLEAAEELGVELAVVAGPTDVLASDAYFGRWSDWECPSQGRDSKIDTLVLHAWVKATKRLAERFNPDAIIPFSEIHVLPAIVVQNHRGLVGPGSEAGAISRDKALQRSAFSAAGVPQPEVLSTGRLPDGFPTTKSSAVVVKSVSESGSRGVELVQKNEWKDLTARRGLETAVLVEEHVDAPDFMWTAIFAGGAPVWSFLCEVETSGAPEFVDLAYLASDGLVTEQLRERIEKACVDAVLSMGVDTAVICLDLRASYNRIAILEVAVRTPGDHSLEVISHSVGTNVAQHVIACYLGATNSPAMPPSSGLKPSAVVYLAATSAGRLVSFNQEDIANLDGVLEVILTVKLGSWVMPPTDSSERLGYVFIEASSLLNLKLLVGRIRDLAQFVIEPRDSISG